MQVKAGSREFAPSLWATLLTLALLGLLVSLGRWQLHRAAEKQVLLDAFAAGTGTLLDADHLAATPARYQHVQLTGHFDPDEQILIDNMFDRGGRAGYYVITPFESAGGTWWLVNRGWVPMGLDRRILPPIPASTSGRTIRGRVDELPRPGIKLGTPPPLSPPFPIRANFPSADDLHSILGKRRWSDRAEVILLDAPERDGFERSWTPPGFPPMRHIAYAVQWFGLAAALLVLYVMRNLRR